MNPLVAGAVAAGERVGVTGALRVVCVVQVHLCARRAQGVVYKVARNG